MSEGAPAPVHTSQFQPSNGAKPSEAQKPAPEVVKPTPSAAPQTPDELAQAKAELKRLSELKAKTDREHIIERRKQEAERKTMGEKLKLADEYAKVKKIAAVDHERAAKMVFGDDWYEKGINARISGGATPAQAVAAMAEEFDAKLESKIAEREQAAKAAAEESEKTARTQAIQSLQSQSVKFFEVVGGEYPALSSLPDATSMLMRAIEQDAPTLARYRRALAEGDLDTQADIFRSKADGLDGQVRALVEKVSKQLQAKTATATVSEELKKSQSLQTSTPELKTRKTLSNDMTASTPPSRPTHRTDREREEAAIAAYNAARSRAKPT